MELINMTKLVEVQLENTRGLVAPDGGLCKPDFHLRFVASSRMCNMVDDILDAAYRKQNVN